jgi:hypothetical protein
VWTIASAPLLCLSALLASPQHLRVDITVQGASAPPALVAAAIAEAADIWAPYDVDIRMSDANDGAHDGAVSLVVTLAPVNRRKETGALGSIIFSGDAPEPLIKLYPEAASALIAAVASARRDNIWPAAPGDRVMARVLGRALAHEVGHFLLRSKSHSTAGLMRADQIGSDLMGPDHHGFALSVDEVRRLRSNLHASATLHPAAAG